MHILRKLFGEHKIMRIALILKDKSEEEVIPILYQIVKKSAFFSNEALESSSTLEKSDDLENIGNMFLSVQFLLKNLDCITQN